MNEAIERQLRDGIVFTLPHPIEVELAERVVELRPRRRARALREDRLGRERAPPCGWRVPHTGRERVLVAATTAGTTGTSARPRAPAACRRAVRELIDGFRFNDLDSLDAALARQPGDTAAVDPRARRGRRSPRPGFLEGVVERAHAAGALVVFDEIITGFRLGAGRRAGALRRAGRPGHASARRSATACRSRRSREALSSWTSSSEVFFSGTHGGEALSIAAALAVLDNLDARAFRSLARGGERLRAGIEGAIESQRGRPTG